MTTAARTKENGCEFSLFKTPLRNPLHTPLRNGMLSSTTLNDISSYSNTKKHLKFVNATSMHDLQMCSETSITPIRSNKTKLMTPVSTTRRQALGLVNHNSNRVCRATPTDDFSTINILKEINTNKVDETKTQKVNSHPEDDLPHQFHSYQDTFDDLIPTNERIEQMFRTRTNGINIFAYNDVENRVRCQSPVSNCLNVSTLLEMAEDILN